MATRNRTAVDGYQCPECAGHLSFTEGSWRCTDCSHVPRHSAD